MNESAKLGSGSFGIVYKATDLVTQKVVAIKQIKKTTITNKLTLQNLKNELNIL